AALATAALFRGGFDAELFARAYGRDDALARLQDLRWRGLVHVRPDRPGRLALFAVVRDFALERAAEVPALHRHLVRARTALLRLTGDPLGAPELVAVATAAARRRQDPELGGWALFLDALL